MAALGLLWSWQNHCSHTPAHRFHVKGRSCTASSAQQEEARLHQGVPAPCCVAIPEPKNCGLEPAPPRPVSAPLSGTLKDPHVLRAEPALLPVAPPVSAAVGSVGRGFVL